MMKINNIFIARIMLLLVSILFLLLMFSCKIAKEKISDRSKVGIENNITAKGVKVTEETLKGGEIDTDIIPIDQRPRDEWGQLMDFIQTYQDGGLTKTIHYKSDGTVHTNCSVDDIIRVIREEFESRDNSVIKSDTKHTEKAKEENFDSSFILYIVIGLCGTIMVLGGIALFFIYRTINKNTDLIKQISNQL